MRTALVVSIALFDLFLPRMALADPPPPEFTIHFDGDAEIWNPFEGFESCATVDESSLCIGLEGVVCNGRGECAGEANVVVPGVLDDSSFFEGRTRCIENPKPNDPVCQARFAIGDLGGSVGSCEIEVPNLRVRGPVDENGVFKGELSARVCATCPGTERQCSTVKAPLDHPVEPIPWTLTVDSHESTENPLRLEGTASDSLGFIYTVRGERSVGDGVSTLWLRGERDTLSEGARIKLRNLVFRGAELQAGTAKIKVQGNIIREKLGH